MLGKTIGGRYQIIRRLGGGGFSQTYLAEDLHLPGNPACAVKQLKPKLTDPDAYQSARRLFDREAEVLYSLGCHDQIPRLFAHFEEAQEFYLVQELIQGQLLSKELKRNKVQSDDYAIAVMRDILTTLEFVHQQQVIHRDIKPSNLIRRDADGRIVLIDFGAVKQISVPTTVAPAGQQTSITIAIGSAGFMPNEQLAGKPRFSSDVYAVGMVGVQALTAMAPSQLADDPRTGEILWREAATVSPELADIIDTMVRYDFRQRYQTASEALAALNRLIGESSSDQTTAFSTLLLPIAPSVSLDSYLPWVERGDDLFHQQRYREALECYDKATEVKTTDYLIWFKRAMALDNLKQHAEAVESYDRVIYLNNEDYLAWFKRGKALEQLKRYPEAIESYDAVIRLQADNYWAWHDRGRVLEALQRYEEAVESYDRAVQLKPDFTLAVQSRRRILSQLKQIDQLYSLQHYDETIASCDQALRDNPEDALAWLMRGMALEQMQHYTGAIASYAQVVKLQPEDHLAWFKLATVLTHLKRHSEAIAAYNHVLKLQPEHAWAWHDRGQVLELEHKFESALASYDKATQLRPDFQSAIEGRQRVLRQLQQLHEEQVAV